MEQNKRIYLATKIWFGKYKGQDKSIYELMLEDITYVDWLLNTAFNEHWIDDRVWKMFNHYWEERNYKNHGFRNDHLNK